MNLPIWQGLPKELDLFVPFRNMKKQSYSNHRQLKWVFQGILPILILASLVGSLINITHSLDNNSDLFDACLVICINLVFCFIYYFLWTQPLRLQDRLIRAEENFRFYIITGKPLDSRLHMSQIIALRFAPDSELADLAKEAIEKHLTGPEIKKLINRWRGDYHRI